MPVFSCCPSTLYEKPVPCIAIVLRDPAAEPCSDQFSPLNTEKRCTGKVYFPDEPFLRKREIADRGKLVEVEVLIARFLQFKACSPEFFGLHLKFDLVHLQVVDKFLRCLSRRAGETLPSASAALPQSSSANMRRHGYPAPPFPGFSYGEPSGLSDPTCGSFFRVRLVRIGTSSMASRMCCVLPNRSRPGGRSTA